MSRRKFIGAILSASALTSTDALAIEPRWLRVRNVRITPQPACRFVQISDIHYKGDHAFLEKVVQAVNAQHPDFVCFTGDLIEDAAYAPAALEILERIEAPLYGIPGNHDHWADLDFDLPRTSFAKNGGRWLMNEDVVTPNGSARLFGMSGLKFFNFQPEAGRKNILLSHYPAGVEGYSTMRFDLTVAGHSHGGQIRIPGYGALIVPFGVNEYQLGLYQTPSGPLYVNAGIGWFYANVRIFCRPEITVFEV
jgi:predicted MPP superfamily phosphohydrolase